MLFVRSVLFMALILAATRGFAQSNGCSLCDVGEREVIASAGIGSTPHRFDPTGASAGTFGGCGTPQFTADALSRMITASSRSLEEVAQSAEGAWILTGTPSAQASCRSLCVELPAGASVTGYRLLSKSISATKHEKRNFTYDTFGTLASTGTGYWPAEPAQSHAGEGQIICSTYVGIAGMQSEVQMHVFYRPAATDAK